MKGKERGEKVKKNERRSAEVDPKKDAVGFI